MGKTTTVKVVVPRGGHLVKQNRGTATAQPTRPAGGRYNVGGAARGGSPPTVASAPILTLTVAPVSGGVLQPYGMQTVHPYVGAVKMVALHIVD